MSSEDYYLELSESPVRFESVSHVTNVFFDDSNKQVFAVRSGGVTGVVVKGPTEDMCTNFRMEDKGPVISIKFSPDQKVLAIQRSKTSVEFINFLNGMDVIEYSQSCKGKNAVIIGFIWTFINEIVFVTDHGVELFQVVPERRSLKALKSISIGVNWFVFCPQSKLLLVSTGVLGNSMQPLQFKRGNLIRLTKFDIELPGSSPRPPKLSLLERDVTLAVVYGQACIIILRHQPRAVSLSGPPTAEVVVYTMHKMVNVRKSHVLNLETSGRFAVNVVDNLIVVHHQASKTSMVFDIGLPGESDGTLSFHQPMTVPLPIHPFTLRVQSALQVSNGEPTQLSCELYSPNWVVFQPDIVIDARLGCLWTVQLILARLARRLRSSPLMLVPLLSRRAAGRSVLFTELRNLLDPSAATPLPIIAEVFDQLNEVYRNFLEVEMQSQMATPVATGGSKPQTDVTLPRAAVVLDQSDMYTGVFSPLAEQQQDSSRSVVSILLEYVRSLGDSRIPVQHFLHELLIDAMVRKKAFFQLHQLLQYHVVADSKPLACLLLSLENVYPAAHQLALDMLRRLAIANEEIVEVLLSKQQVLPALRFVKSAGSVDQASARKFLEFARATGDDQVFFAVFRFFEQRNLRLRGSPAFTKGEHCDIYVKYYMETFCRADENFNSDISSQ